jgi:hypothetical protein
MPCRNSKPDCMRRSSADANCASDFPATAASSGWENSRPIAAPICATSFAEPSRSSRAINDACKLAGTAGAGAGIAAAIRWASLALSVSSTRLGHFFDEQRDAVSTLNDVLPNACRERLVAEDAVDHRVDVALWQAIEGQSGYMRLSVPGRHKFRPKCNEQQNAKGRDSIYNSAERFQTRRIGPMSVLEDHQNRILPGKHFHLQNEGLQGSVSALLRGKVEDRIAPIVRQRQHVGE